MTNSREAFEREERYIVIKRKWLKLLDDDSRALLDDFLVELSLASTGDDDGIRGFGCVVVEKDWPMYECVWQMIEKYANGLDWQAALAHKGSSDES